MPMPPRATVITCSDTLPGSGYGGTSSPSLTGTWHDTQGSSDAVITLVQSDASVTATKPGEDWSPATGMVTVSGDQVTIWIDQFGSSGSAAGDQFG